MPSMKQVAGRRKVMREVDVQIEVDDTAPDPNDATKTITVKRMETVKQEVEVWEDYVEMVPMSEADIRQREIDEAELRATGGN